MKTVVGALALLAGGLWASGAAAQALQPDDTFLIDMTGQGVQINRCWTTPYPKCAVQWIDREGNVLPTEVEVWQEDLLKYREDTLAAMGTPTIPPGQPGGACAPTVYVGPIPGDVPVTGEMLMQRIVDSYTMAARPPTINISVAFETFGFEQPFYNEAGQLPGGGASLINNGAPENALIYPVRTRHIVCDDDYSSHALHDSLFHCFVSDAYEWTCGVAESVVTVLD